MALLVSEGSSDPWRGKAFTFSDPPRLLKVEGDHLRSKSEFLWEKNSGEDLNLLKVYHRVLQVGITEKLGNEKMAKRVFVFTNCGEESGLDMERWEKDYKEAWKSFRKRGYKSVPEIVYWDLRGSNKSGRDEEEEEGDNVRVLCSPVNSHHRGLTLIRGYSVGLVRVLMEGGVDFSKADNVGGEEKEELMWQVVSLVKEPQDLIASVTARDDERFKDLVLFD